MPDRCSPFEIVDGEVVDYGPDGNDEIYGGTGNDRLIGSHGDDRLYGNEPQVGPAALPDLDSLFGGPGIDRLYGGDWPDGLEGRDEGDFLYGEGGGDWLLGQGGPDSLRGGSDSDQLWGGASNDTLSAFGDGGARDLLNCGPGMDTADVDPNDTFYVGATNNNATAAEAGCERVARHVDSYRAPPVPGPQPERAPQP